MTEQYDIVVLGGGSAGLFAASAAVNQKAKTCLIEKRRLGGDCTWYGCIPSKTLLKSAQIAQFFNKSNQYGIAFDNPHKLITDDVLKHVRAVREEIGSHETLEIFEAKGMKVIIGSPEFKSMNILQVNGQNIQAKKFIVCTGSHPVIPLIEGLKDIDYLTNETIFELEKLPESMIVLGGGSIGIELSQAFLRLGVKVSTIEMMDKIMFREDHEAVEILEKKLRTEGLEIYTGKKAIKFEKKAAQIIVSLQDKSGAIEVIKAEKVLVAVGRAPNIEGLNFEACGIEYTKNGIKVNQYLQTTNKNIFSCGDIASVYQFSHVAAYTAYLCVRNAMFKKLAWSKVNYDNIPWTTFSDPELSRIGFTEEQAAEKFGKDAIRVYKTNYSSSDRAITDLVADGLVKIITNKKGLILGAHIVGAQAGEIIQGLLIAKSLKIPLAKLAEIMFIYPTLSELIKKTAAQPLVESLNNPILKAVIGILKNK